MKQISNYIYYIIPFIIFLYPQGLLDKLYINYTYVIMCWCIFLLTKYKSITKTFPIVIFRNLLIVVILSNFTSFLLGKTSSFDIFRNIMLYFSCYCITVIISNLTSNIENRRIFLNIFKYTSFLVIGLILVETIFHPSWIKEYIQPDRSSSEIINEGVYFRASGSLVSPVMAGFYCGTYITYLLSKYTHEKLTKFDYFMLTSSIIALFTTASRTSMLAIGFVFIIYFTIIKFSIKFLLFIPVIFFLFFNLNVFSDSVQNLLLRNENQLSGNLFEGTGRLDTIIFAVENKIDIRSMFFGIGPAEYAIDNSGYSFAHNGILSIIIPTGLFGIYIFSRLFFRPYIEWRTLQNKTNRISDKTIILFRYLYVILSLGTFFTADMPVSYFWLVLTAFIFSFTNIK